MPRQNENLQTAVFELDFDPSEQDITPKLGGVYNPAYRWNGWTAPYAWYSEVHGFCESMGWTLDIEQDGSKIVITFPDGTFDTFPKETVVVHGVPHRGMYNMEGLVWRVS